MNAIHRRETRLWRGPDGRVAFRGAAALATVGRDAGAPNHGMFAPPKVLAQLDRHAVVPMDQIRFNPRLIRGNAAAAPHGSRPKLDAITEQSRRMHHPPGVRTHQDVMPRTVLAEPEFGFPRHRHERLSSDERFSSGERAATSPGRKRTTMRPQTPPGPAMPSTPGSPGARGPNHEPPGFGSSSVRACMPTTFGVPSSFGLTPFRPVSRKLAKLELEPLAASLATNGTQFKPPAVNGGGVAGRMLYEVIDDPQYENELLVAVFSREWSLCDGTHYEPTPEAVRLKVDMNEANEAQLRLAKRAQLAAADGAGAGGSAELRARRGGPAASAAGAISPLRQHPQFAPRSPNRAPRSPTAKREPAPWQQQITHQHFLPQRRAANISPNLADYRPPPDDEQRHLLHSRSSQEHLHTRRPPSMEIEIAAHGRPLTSPVVARRGVHPRVTS